MLEGEGGSNDSKQVMMFQIQDKPVDDISCNQKISMSTIWRHSRGISFMEKTFFVGLLPIRE
jgi:hypothetical protein